GRRHALDPRSVLGSEALAVPSADRARTGRAGSRRRLQVGRDGREGAAHAGLAVAQHVAGGSRRDRQRGRLCIRERRGRDAGDVRRRAVLQHVSEPHRAFLARDAVCARRAHRRGTVVERRPDYVIQSLQQPGGRQRPSLSRNVRRHAVLLRRQADDSDNEVAMRIQRLQRLIGAGMLVSASVALLHAQGRGGPEWTTSGFDAQRSGLLRADARLTKDAVQKGEFALLWSMKIENTSRQLNSLTPPVLLDRLIGYRGFKSLAFFGGSDDRVFAVDTDLARPAWTTILNYS